jgi:hypothetical protein
MKGICDAWAKRLNGYAGIHSLVAAKVVIALRYKVNADGDRYVGLTDAHLVVCLCTQCYSH